MFFCVILVNYCYCFHVFLVFFFWFNSFCCFFCFHFLFLCSFRICRHNTGSIGINIIGEWNVVKNGVNSMSGFLSRSHRKPGSFTHHFATDKVELSDSKAALNARPNTPLDVLVPSHPVTIKTAQVQQFDEVHVVPNKLAVTVVCVFLHAARCI